MGTSLRQAWKSWQNARSVALLAMLALAIGIGSATAIYTVAVAVLLKPLPYRESDRFVALYGARRDEPKSKSAFSYKQLSAFAERQRAFDVFGWFSFADFNLTFAGHPEHADGIRVTPRLVRSLGVQPEIGRWFGEAEQESGSAHLAVLSHSFWQRLGGQTSIVGQNILLDGQSYTITGVAPAWFRLPLAGPAGEAIRRDLWIPLDPQAEKAKPDWGEYFCYARIKPGLTFAQAEADAKRVAAAYAREHPDEHGLDTAQVESLRRVVSQDIRPTLLLLLAATGVLLLITCANVAGLLVTRAVGRARETAIRLALGAAQGRLILQYFSEGLLVALGGAAAGIGLSYGLVHVIVSVAADSIARSNDIAVDWSALLFAIGIALLASFLTSLAPLWQALRTSPRDILNEGVRASAGVGSRRTSQGLVVAEIALTFTLLAVSALLLGQLERLNHVQPGFDPSGLVAFQLTATDPGQQDSHKLAAYQKTLLGALEAIPGVSGAAVVNQLPVNGCCMSTTIFPEGHDASTVDASRVSFLPISSHYFQTLKIPLQAGRLLTDHDTSETVLSAVINQATAQHHWPRRNPVGAYGHFLNANGSRFQVMGVVGNVRNDDLSKPTVPEIYLSAAVAPQDPVRFVVRSSLPEKTLVPAMRQAIRRVNPNQPIYDIRSMQEVIDGSLTLQRATSLLTGFFAGAALLLATLGVYGVVAYSVRQRTVEIGTRMALGAANRDVWQLVLGGGLKMALGGLIVGGAAVLAATVALLKASVIQSAEPFSFVYATAAVGAMALAGSLYPAWRATQLSPMVAIRNESGTIWQGARERLKKTVGELSGRLTGREEEDGGAAAAKLLTGFIDAARQADTAGEALHKGLAAICDEFNAESAWMFADTGSGDLRCTVSFPAANAARAGGVLPARRLLLQRLLSYDLPLPIAKKDLDVWAGWAAEQRPQHAAEIALLQRVEARLAISLRAKKETLGVLLLGPRTGREEYTAAEKRMARISAGQFALMLENARLTARVVEQEKLNRDLALAAEVQKRMLPDGYPASTTGDLAAFTLPARSVGGDYYDFVKIGEHNIGIALADVAGKGVAAALIMSVIQASLRILSAEENLSLPQLVGKMNRFLHRSTGVSSYATFFYAQLDEQNRQLSYINAGHNPPILLRSESENDSIEELSTGGMIIGMFDKAEYQEAKIDLKEGDVLVAFTDGVTEALNIADEEYGEERLKHLLRGLTHLPVNEIAARMAKELRAWIGDAPQHDDLTFLVLKVR